MAKKNRQHSKNGMMMRRILLQLREFDLDEVKILCDKYTDAEDSRATRKRTRRIAKKSSKKATSRITKKASPTPKKTSVKKTSKTTLKISKPTPARATKRVTRKHTD